jgi:hypothetical protein
MPKPFDYEQLSGIRAERPRMALRFAAALAVGGVIVLIAIRSELGVLAGAWLIGVAAVVAVAAAFLRIGYDEDFERAGEMQRRRPGNA